MDLFLVLAFLFFIGSVSGWVIELLFRRFLSSANPERKWINPGFCTGPYVPIYGFGLCIMYLTASSEKLFKFGSSIYGKLLIFAVMAVMMTVIEYIAGIFLLKVANLRLWDYSREWGNINGLICPKFSLIWASLGAVYYFVIHPKILNALNWFSQNLAFSFIVGLFFGIFIIDAANSAQIVVKLKRFAAEKNVVVRYEHLKIEMRKAFEEKSQKYHFFRPFHSNRPFSEYLNEMRDSYEKKKIKNKKAKG